MKIDEKQNDKDQESATKSSQKNNSESKKQKPKIKIKQDIPKSLQDFDKKSYQEDYDEYTLEQLEDKLTRLQQDMDYEVQIIQEMYQNKIQTCSAAIQKLKNTLSKKHKVDIYYESLSESYNQSFDSLAYDNAEVDSRDHTQKKTHKQQVQVTVEALKGQNGAGGGVISKNQEEEKKNQPSKAPMQSSEQICKKIAKLPFNFQVDAQFFQQFTNIAQNAQQDTKQETKKEKSLPFEFAPHLPKQPPQKLPPTKSLPFSFQPFG